MTKKQIVRYADSPPVYTVYSQLKKAGIAVCCPCCGKEALLKETDGEYHITCKSCHHSQKHSTAAPVRAAQGCCKFCFRWFNIKLPSSASFYPRVKISCPYCKQPQIAQTVQVAEQEHSVLKGLSLYFKDSFRGHPIWALNREHLHYLIAYICADLREKYSYVYARQRDAVYYGSSGQSQQLPRYMKRAKNRKDILKILRRMEKW